MVRRGVGDYPGRNMAIPSRFHLGIGFAGMNSAGIGIVYHVHGPQGVPALQSVRVYDAPSRGGQLPFRRVCDACPPRVAYRVILCQHHDKWGRYDDGPFSLTFVLWTGLPGSLEFLEIRRYRSADEM